MHAGGSALAGDVDDRLVRNGDHRQLHGLWDVGDRTVRPHTVDHVVTGMDDREAAAVARRAQVPEHGAADRALAARDADHGDRRGPQHVGDGGGGRYALAVLEARARLGAQLRRELDPELARLGMHLDSETGVAEHLHHPMVLRHHEGR